MGARYLKEEVKIIRKMYPTEPQEDLMDELPRRDWIAISKYARHKLGLHRSKKAKGLAVLAGLAEGKRKREEEGDTK